MLFLVGGKRPLGDDSFLEEYTDGTLADSFLCFDLLFFFALFVFAMLVDEIIEVSNTPMKDDASAIEPFRDLSSLILSLKSKDS